MEREGDRKYSNKNKQLLNTWHIHFFFKNSIWVPISSAWPCKNAVAVLQPSATGGQLNRMTSMKFITSVTAPWKLMSGREASVWAIWTVKQDMGHLQWLTGVYMAGDAKTLVPDGSQSNITKLDWDQSERMASTVQVCIGEALNNFRLVEIIITLQ